MASISREANGRRTIQFVAADRKRKSIRLGKVSQRVAEAVKVRVERLASAIITRHAVDDETARWVAELDDVLLDKLAAAGLVPRRDAAALAGFIDRYIQTRGDVKPATGTVYAHTRRCLIEFFGSDRLLRDVTPGDADEWRLWLFNDQKLADNTVRRRCGIAKQFFKAAFKAGGFVALTPERYAAVRRNWGLCRAGRGWAGHSHRPWQNRDMMNNVLRDTKRYMRMARIDVTAPLTLHTFRKSFAQNHADAGTPPRTLAKLLGHSEVRVTMKFYNQVTEANETAAAQTMDRLLGTGKPDCRVRGAS